MFRRLFEPLPLSEASMLALRPALNAPVLNVDYLPVGPARAAIVVFAEEWGGIGVAIGIRSNEGGQIAVLRNRESIEPDVTIGAALEPALAEAEQLGFLFDEDMVENTGVGQGRGHAMELWGRLMGEVEEPPTPRAASPEPGPAAAGAGRSASPRRPQAQGLEEVEAVDELVLDDVARGATPRDPLELTQDISNFELQEPPKGRPSGATPPAVDPLARRSGEISVQTEPFDLEGPDIESEAALPRELPPQQTLSKFRNLPDSSPAPGANQGEAPDGADPGSKLGRIPLVRVRRGRDGKRRVPYLARLLSSF